MIPLITEFSNSFSQAPSLSLSLKEDLSSFILEVLVVLESRRGSEVPLLFLLSSFYRIPSRRLFSSSIIMASLSSLPFMCSAIPFGVTSVAVSI